ncbi:MAG: signal peptide peptidase SppA [Candidatus Cryptobacteroides sp.]
MKDFVKMTLATLLGLLIFGVLSFFFSVAMLGALASLGETTPVMPREGILKMDMSEIVISEQTQEMDPVSFLQSGDMIVPVGIRSAVNAINKAAEDPAIKFIYLLPDGISGGMSQIEELRTALENFRKSSKAVISYIENPTNAGYYLASVSDKVYMSSYEGGMNTLSGISSQMYFLKDILDRIGVNVQLIRHGKYKSAGEMYIRNSASKENEEQYREMISSVWGTWAEGIARSREISVSDLNSMIDNLELLYPSDFKEKGLVDETLTKEELRNKLCDLYVTDNYKRINTISLQDYAKLNNVPNVKAQNKVAVVYANGEIVDGDDERNVSGDKFAKLLADIRNDSSVKAVVFRVNSPGGSVFASEKIKNEINLLKESKPVIASYGDYAASGGYWISAGCDKIFSNATTLTGSIGVFSMIPDFSKVLKDKIHINVTTINSNKHSDMYSMTRPLDEKETAYMQASVESIYEKFTGLVAEGRNMSVADVDAIAQGRVWTGADALKIGLVDEIGTLEDAISYAALSIEGVNSVEEVQIVDYPKPLNTFEMLLESFSSTSDPEILSGTPFSNVAAAFRNWDASESGKVYARMPYLFDIK